MQIASGFSTDELLDTGRYPIQRGAGPYDTLVAEVRQRL